MYRLVKTGDVVDRITLNRLNKQNDDNDYTESLGTNSNAEKSPDTNQILNDLGFGDSNTENKTK